MSAFFVLAWNPANPDAAAHAGALERRMEAQGAWTSRARQGGSVAWTSGAWTAPIATSAGGRAVLVGRLHAPIGGSALPAAYVAALLDDEPPAACRRLTAAAWGAYVAVFSPEDGPTCAYRDPSGALEAFAWGCGRGVYAVASGVEGLPPGLLPPRLALDWSRIARILRQPGRSAMESPLQGISPLAAGRITPLDRPEASSVVWTPAAFAGAPTRDLAGAGEELTRRIDGTVAAMAAPHRTLVAELSGGLDSAIVAASLHRAGLAARAAAWINYYVESREGDERSYARAMAVRIGVALTEAPLGVEPVGEADYAELARGVRPPMSALGRGYDRDMAARAAACGATGILTGQGGDAAFFQMATPFVLADALRLDGWRALFTGAWGDTARWTGRSAWAVLAALRSRGAVVEPPPLLPGLDPGTGLSQHPWVREAEGLPPAKRLHIAALAAGQVYPGDSSRRRAAEVLRPLLAQPVMEHLLAIPAPVLTQGGRDRALARSAFAGRLPEAIVERRAKGMLSAYYGQVVLASLDWLRPHLLEGCLCEAGVLDRHHLDARLTPGALVWNGGSVDLLAAALMESWVRHWQGRIPDSAASPRPRPA